MGTVDGCGGEAITLTSVQGMEELERLRPRCFDGMGLVRQMMVLTIEHGWPTGRRPDGAPCAACSEADLVLAG